MIISPNENGWSFDKSISTQNVLFVGTQEECEAEIATLGLTWSSEEYVEETVNDSDNH